MSTSNMTEFLFQTGNIQPTTESPQQQQHNGSSVLERVKQFLPFIAEANSKLAQNQKEDGTEDEAISIEVLKTAAHQQRLDSDDDEAETSSSDNSDCPSDEDTTTEEDEEEKTEQLVSEKGGVEKKVQQSFVQFDVHLIEERENAGNCGKVVFTDP